jgi:hypothetical protein
MSAELEARRATSAAVVADFRAECARHPASRPPDGSWAYRLAGEVDWLLEATRVVTRGIVIDRGRGLTLLQMIRDAVAWQRRIGDKEAADQAVLYRALASEARITEQAIGGVENVRYAQETDLRPAVLLGNYDLTSDEVRTVLSALDRAAEAERDAAGICNGCDAEPDGGFCATCEMRLSTAGEFDALRERIQEVIR